MPAKVLNGGNKWGELKADIPGALIKDLARHMGMPEDLMGPFISPDPVFTAAWPVLIELESLLRVPGAIQNVHANTRKGAGAGRECDGNFELRFKMPHPAGEIAKCVEKLDVPLRLASGLAVRGGQTISQRPTQHVLLVFFAMTDTERARKRQRTG